MKQPFLTLYDFSDHDASQDWYPVNDTVMGGLSRSRFYVTKDGIAVFRGEVLPDNNGGFASIRSPRQTYDLSPCNGLQLRVKGDGKRYRCRLIMDNMLPGLAYQLEFDTETDVWTVVKLAFNNFSVSLRGRPVPDAPDLHPGRIYQFGLMIADKQFGPFRLHIDWIKAGA